MNNIIQAVQTCLQRKYADFNGRASRAEYWWYVLGIVIVEVVLYILAFILASIHLDFIASILLMIVGLGILVPSIAVATRRLHDVNKSGWFQLISLIPFGAFYVLYLLAQPSQPEANQYGAPPAA